MRTRPGVSLVETLVAAVLLMLGIGGSLHALATSARLRSEADAREALSLLLLDRLAWFEALACAGGDTSGVTHGLRNGISSDSSNAGPRLQWRVQAVGTVRVLTLDGARRATPSGPRTRILTSRACE